MGCTRVNRPSCNPPTRGLSSTYPSLGAVAGQWPPLETNSYPHWAGSSPALGSRLIRFPHTSQCPGSRKTMAKAHKSHERKIARFTSIGDRPKVARSGVKAKVGHIGEREV